MLEIILDERPLCQPQDMNVNEIPARLVKRQRRKRKSYKSLPVDQRPDEALVWDIEAAPDNPEPLQKYAERLIVRKQYERAICDDLVVAIERPSRPTACVGIFRKSPHA